MNTQDEIVIFVVCFGNIRIIIIIVIIIIIEQDVDKIVPVYSRKSER